MLLKYQTSSLFHLCCGSSTSDRKIPSVIDLSSGLLFYLFLYELQKSSRTFCPPRVDRDQMSKQINILHILILNVDLTNELLRMRTASIWCFEINPIHFSRELLVNIFRKIVFSFIHFYLMLQEQGRAPFLSP